MSGGLRRGAAAVKARRMASTALPPQASRRRRGRVLACLLALVVLVPLLLAVETQPRVRDVGPPDASAAALVRDLALRLQDFAEPRTGGPAEMRASAAEINAAFASLARLQPGVAGRVAVTDGRLDGTLSAGGPLLPGGLWLNLRASLVEGPEGTEIAAVRVGRLALPPALVVPVLRALAERELGPGAGALAMNTLAALRIEAPEVVLAMAPGELAGGGRLERLKARLRALASGTTGSERVVAHLRALHRAAGAAGFDDDANSVLPFLRAGLARAEAEAAAGSDPEAEMRAAIFALALYCGDPRFGLAIGVWVPQRMQGLGSHCATATLEGRHDLVRHFVLSAGIHAASTEGAVAGLGELKELLDSNPEGTGFSFDDMAANLAGARFATRLMAADPADWPAIAAAIGAEADILPSIDDLPSGLAAADFEAVYGDIDSAPYRALLAEIEGRIDALPIHRGG